MTAPRFGPGEGPITATGAPLAVQRWVGQGSYAHVYQARLSNSRTCALKLSKAELPEARHRMEREAAVLTQVSHPRLVRLLDRGDWQSTPFLVLEWLEGPTLFDLTHPRKRLPLRQAVDHVLAVTEAVEAIHRAGETHGDVRSENVIVVPERGAVLTDPGALPDALGDAPDDVRALGALLHRLLTGVDPSQAVRLTRQEGFSRSVVELWSQMRSESPPTAAELRDTLADLRRTL